MHDSSHAAAGRISVVLCGSFRRDPDQLRATHRVLSELYTVISPTDVSWIDSTAEFVRLPHEVELSTHEIERAHLRAMQCADFVWLHCPDGYVGTSAAMEIGYADAHGIPVLAAVKPADQTLADMVAVVDGGPGLATEHLAARPGNAIAGLQRYYHRAAARRGWADESARDTMLLLTEEFGELARAIRKESGLRRDGDFGSTNVAEELADIQLYLVHLANALGVDLADAVTSKEAVNARRFAERSAA